MIIKLLYESKFFCSSQSWLLALLFVHVQARSPSCYSCYFRGRAIVWRETKRLSAEMVIVYVQAGSLVTSGSRLVQHRIPRTIARGYHGYRNRIAKDKFDVFCPCYGSECATIIPSQRKFGLYRCCWQNKTTEDSQRKAS